MTWFGRRQRAQRVDRQAGSVIVPAAAALLVGLVLLGAAQLGQNFYIKRELQNAADLAALAGAQSLGAGDTLGCQQAQRMADISLRSQEGSAAAELGGAGVQVQCGRWEGGAHDPAQRFTEGLPAHSVQVRLRHQAPSLFPFLSPASIDALAVANTSEPVATFSVGSRLLALKKNGLVYQLLRGVGLSANDLRVLDSAGLVNASITPSGLLKALGLPATVIAGVGTPDELARLEQLTLADLLDASLELVDQQKTLGLDVGALQEFIRLLLGVGALDVPIKLLGEGGVLAVVDGVDPLSALNVKLDVLQLVSTGLVVANGANLIDLNLSGLPISPFNKTVDLRVRIVEPPSIAVGGVGTTANSAGVRVYLKLDTSNIPAVGPILKVLGTQVSLPLIIELSQARGKLVNVCRAPIERDQATVAVTSSLVNVCLGQFPHNDFFSASNSCKDTEFGTIERHEIINVLGILPLTAKVALPLISSKSPREVTLTAPPGSPSEDTVKALDINLGDSVRLLSDAIFDGLLGDILNAVPAVRLSAEEKKKMASSLVGDGEGRSISAVAAEMNWSKERMNQIAKSMGANGLTGVLGGTLSLVDNLLVTILAAPLGDFLCLLGGIGGEKAMNDCRVGAVETLVLKGNGVLSDQGSSGLLGAVLNMVVALLDPVLHALSALLEGLLQLLGLSLVEADVKLHDVQCGTAYLVQ
ncbi:pilus assembly protein TadG-related protein [Alcaligenes sp. SDU_A2]|uniref:pilus assembly protein TadG-related protein n=1 Tax=Alcaligenes sp. SDU_A2 TaxID=3136634 RepID=UPI00311E9078